MLVLGLHTSLLSYDLIFLDGVMLVVGLDTALLTNDLIFLDGVMLVVGLETEPFPSAKSLSNDRIINKYRDRVQYDSSFL